MSSDPVRWREGLVTLNGTCGDRSFSCDAGCGVMILPLGVLQAESVHFDPYPRGLEQQTAAMVMGPVTRSAPSS